MGEQSYATISLRPLSHYHTTKRRGESVGGSRGPFARDTWEKSLSLTLSLSLLLSHTHAHTQMGARLNNNLHLLAPIKTDQWMGRTKVKNQFIIASLPGEIQRMGSLQWRHLLGALEVQTEKCEDWKRGKTIFPALTATVLRLTAAPTHQQWLAEQSHLERPACQWEVTYTMPPSCTYQFSVRPCCAVRFIWVRKCRAHWGTVKRTDGCSLRARIGTG